MPELTRASTHDARDAEDNRLLESGEYSALVESYYGGVRVGTVDKFQGQEAPVVVVSLASSSAEDAPRGLGFAFNRNRINVATSRAQCRVVLV